MSSVDAIKNAYQSLSPAEQRELALWLSQVDRGSDVPGIHKTPGVCGGSARIGDTRIAVWLLESMRRGGASEQDILKGFPNLAPSSLAAAWEYVDRHKAEIDMDIAGNEAD